MPAIVDGPAARGSGSALADRPPRIRVRPAPALEPPFDGEHERPSCGVEMLPLSAARPTGATTVASGRRPTPVRPGGRSGGMRPREAVSAREQEGGCFGPAATRRFVKLCIEVVNGFRPVAQLRPLTAPDRFTAVADQILRRTVRLRMSSGSKTPVRVRRIQICEPMPSVVEAAVVLHHGDRCWAMALRLERRREGWQCVLVQVI